MTMLNTAGSWHVGNTRGNCAACSVELAPGVACWAALCDGGAAVAKAAAAQSKESRKTSKKEEATPAVSSFVRVDFCEKCWAEGKRPEQLSAEVLTEIVPGAVHPTLEMFSFWKTAVPVPQQKKRLLVDDSVLMDVFQRMEGKNEPQEVRFRFVLALILMRKRLLKYEGMEEAIPGVSTSSTESVPPGGDTNTASPETWRMIPRGTDQIVHVINPHLTADQITEVSQQLSAILAEEV